MYNQLCIYAGTYTPYEAIFRILETERVTEMCRYKSNSKVEEQFLLKLYHSLFVPAPKD